MTNTDTTTIEDPHHWPPPTGPLYNMRKTGEQPPFRELFHAETTITINDVTYIKGTPISLPSTPGHPPWAGPTELRDITQWEWEPYTDGDSE